MMSHPLLKFCNNFVIFSTSSLPFPLLTQKGNGGPLLPDRKLLSDPHPLNPYPPNPPAEALMLSLLERALPPCTWPPRGHSLENHQGL